MRVIPNLELLERKRIFIWISRGYLRWHLPGERCAAPWPLPSPTLHGFDGAPWHPNGIALIPAPPDPGFGTFECPVFLSRFAVRYTLYVSWGEFSPFG